MFLLLEEEEEWRRGVERQRGQEACIRNFAVASDDSNQWASSLGWTKEKDIGNRDKGQF